MEQDDCYELEQDNVDAFITKVLTGERSDSLQSYHDVIGLLLDIAFKYKHPGFKDELEYRVDYIGDDVRIKEKNKKEIRYIERDFDLSWIEKVIIGPSNEQTELHRKTQIVLEIKKLKIPY